MFETVITGDGAIKSGYTRLRSEIHLAWTCNDSLYDVLSDRWDLLEDLKLHFAEWQAELQQKRLHVDETWRFASELGADSAKNQKSMPAASYTLNIFERSKKDGVFLIISQIFASISKAMEFFGGPTDEFDEWWNPFISTPVTNEARAHLIKQTVRMRGGWNALRAGIFPFYMLRWKICLTSLPMLR